MRPEDEYFILIFVRYVFVTYAISWLIWSLLVIFPQSDYLYQLWIAILGLYGPSIAAVILSFRFQGVYWQHYIPKIPIFLTIFIISSLLGIGYMLQLIGIFPLPVGVIFLILLASALTAYFISLMVMPPPGFETRNASPLQIRSHVGMILFALLLPFCIGLISYSIQLSFNFTEIVVTLSSIMKSAFQYPFYVISYYVLFSGASNEEIGWRGYLTPKLLQRITPLNSGLFVGVIWTLWHLPLHLSGFYTGGLSSFWYRIAWNIPLGIVFTWYYMKSGYNLLGAILLHAAFNMFSFIGEIYLIPAYIITSLVMVYESKMWEPVYVSPENPKS